MKIIDEKGRLFGKINMIDFLVILFLFCILPAFYFGYKIMTKKAVVETQKKEFVEIETNCRLIKLKPEILKLISVGDKILNEDGQVTGEIISLGQTEPYRYELDIGTREKIVKEDPILKQIEAKLRLKAEVKGNNLYCKDKLIKIGFPFKVKTNKCTLVVCITKKKKEEIVKEASVKAILKVKFSNLWPEIARIIKSGDKQVEGVEFAQVSIEKIVAKVVRVVSNEPAEVISLMEDRKNWSVAGHPKHKDLILEIETFCERKPKGLFLKNKPVKIGKGFEFSTGLYSISGTIIGIEEK